MGVHLVHQYGAHVHYTVLHTQLRQQTVHPDYRAILTFFFIPPSWHAATVTLPSCWPQKAVVYAPPRPGLHDAHLGHRADRPGGLVAVLGVVLVVVLWQKKRSQRRELEDRQALTELIECTHPPPTLPPPPSPCPLPPAPCPLPPATSALPPPLCKVCVLCLCLEQ